MECAYHLRGRLITCVWIGSHGSSDRLRARGETIVQKPRAALDSDWLDRNHETAPSGEMSLRCSISAFPTACSGETYPGVPNGNAYEISRPASLRQSTHPRVRAMLTAEIQLRASFSITLGTSMEPTRAAIIRTATFKALVEASSSYHPVPSRSWPPTRFRTPCNCLRVVCSPAISATFTD